MRPNEVVSALLAKQLAQLSQELGRQVGVLITRSGQVRNVIVGDATQLDIPEIGRLRGGTGRFRRLRLAHTHLQGEPLSQDDLNDLALLRLDLILMLEVAQDGRPGRVEVAHLLPQVSSDSKDPFRRIQAPDLTSLQFDFQATVAALETEFSRITRRTAKDLLQGRALVICLDTDPDSRAEMLELVRSAGVEVAASLGQRRKKPHPRTAVGPGKLPEIVLEAMRRQVDVAIFDVDLKPAQARAFEDATGLRAVDRTQLILDIFAQRAKSKDGKLQVELAQLKYALPRLSEKDAGLSRLTGGIGTRGPGETVMEVGRRRIRDRIRSLEKQIVVLSKRRSLRRHRRSRMELPVLSIIGYTNAGKSSLLNALTGSRVAAADRLFMTLDPTSRRLRFPREREVIITDTVGFMSDLPKDLISAFRATLEELEDAHLLLHVIDVGDERFGEKLRAVELMLRRLELDHIPILRVLNKADLLDPAKGDQIVQRFGGVLVSARQRTGLEELVERASVVVAPEVSS